jgi:hypothetical protein
MEDFNRIRGKIKGQIKRFSGMLVKDFPRPDQKFITQVIYGIQASKDVKLSNIGRALKEKISLKKTEDRLSYNISKEDISHKINERISFLSSKRIHDEMVLSLDIGDVRKYYAKAMENLAKVRDGSKKEIGEGYWLCKVIASDISGEKIIPLYNELYSQASEDFKSENHQMLKAMDTVIAHTKKKGIWAIDRGGDRNKILEAFFERRQRFVIRLVGDRDLIDKDGYKINSLQMASCYRCRHQAKIVRIKKGKEKIYHLNYGMLPVRLPWNDTPLFMVIIKGFGKKPMMLLTNLKVETKIKESIWRVAEIYFARWKCEESFRYIKQSYNLEDIRLLTYKGLRNMVSFLLAVSYFVSTYLGDSLKLKLLFEKILIISNRFFGVPTFFHYAVADGIYNCLFSGKCGLDEQRKTYMNFQLALPFDEWM